MGAVGWTPDSVQNTESFFTFSLTFECVVVICGFDSVNKAHSISVSLLLHLVYDLASVP